jgi:hypothetical protein
MNSREKTSRDNQIVAAHMRGLSWATIAATYELSERGCQTILADYRASHPRLRERDPIELLDDMLDRYEAAQEELALVSATTKHDATRVGAIRTRLDALAAQTNLLMLVGVLPRDLGVLRHDIDARAIASELVAAHAVRDSSRRSTRAARQADHPQERRRLIVPAEFITAVVTAASPSADRRARDHGAADQHPSDRGGGARRAKPSLHPSSALTLIPIAHKAVQRSIVLSITSS